MSLTFLPGSSEALKPPCQSFVGRFPGRVPTQTGARVPLLHHRGEAQALYLFFFFAGLEDYASEILL